MNYKEYHLLNDNCRNKAYSWDVNNSREITVLQSITHTSYLLVFLPWSTISEQCSKTDFHVYRGGVRGEQLAIYHISKTDVFTYLNKVYTRQSLSTSKHVQGEWCTGWGGRGMSCGAH